MKNPFQSATKRFISKEIENQLYAKASEDMENNTIHKGIWTRAFAKADGNESRQKAIYIELMVQHYKDEIAAGEEIEKILMSEAEKELARLAEENKIRQEAERKKQEEAAWNHPDAVAARAKAAEEQAKQDEDAARVISILAWALILVSLTLLFFNS